MTRQAGNQHVPTWSHDGRWVYFSAGEAAALDIWRVPATGGPAQQVTHGGSGAFASETADGQGLLYQPKPSDSPLLVQPLTGAPTQQLIACVKSTAFGSTPDGVIYVPCESTPDPPLYLRELKTGRDRRLGTLEQFEQSADAPALGLSLSGDGLTVLYLRHMSDTADLLLIENFK